MYQNTQFHCENPIKMKKASFEKTVDILVRAYFEGTLEHGWCSACAVGNIVAESLGTKPQSRDNYFSNGAFASWSFVFYTGCQKQNFYPEAYHGNAKNQIDSTGYSLEELMKIEAAFESVTKEYPINKNDSIMFSGLMAVVDVLADIHQIDLKAKEEAKLLFVKP